jgi:hypothetical protein
MITDEQVILRVGDNRAGTAAMSSLPFQAMNRGPRARWRLPRRATRSPLTRRTWGTSRSSTRFVW